MRHDFYVYLYLHPKTGTPIYVGKGQGKRWLQHKCLTLDPKHESTNSRLHRVLKKYGDCPVVKLRNGLTDDQSKAIEIALIAAIGRADQKKGPLFNFTDGGDGSNGFKHTEESKLKSGARSLSPEKREQWKAKISASHKGKHLSPETRAAISEAWKGRKRGPKTPEHRAKLAAAHIGMKASPETRAKMSAARLGKKMPEGTGAKIAAAQMGNKRGLGHKRSPEALEATRQATIGRKHTDEQRAKMRAAWAKRKGVIPFDDAMRQEIHDLMSR